MIPRQHPLDPPALLFAAGGASGHAEPDSAEAFDLAHRLGATGIESELRMTADGVLILRRDPKLGGFRRRKLAETPSAELPEGVTTLAAFFAGPAGGLDLLAHAGSIDVADAALDAALANDAVGRLWLASDDRPLLTACRRRSEVVRLVETTPLAALELGPERHAADLRELAIDAVAWHRSDWNGGRVALLHRFGRRCLGTDAPHERMIAALLHIGLDGVCSGYPDRLVEAATAQARPDAPAFLDD